MECNNKIEKELMIAFTIILDNIYSNKVKFAYGLFKYNYGVLFESRPFNENWKPS
jgi:hypothetical protein